MLTWDSLCSISWLHTSGDLRASVSRMLQLPSWTTMSGFVTFDLLILLLRSSLKSLERCFSGWDTCSSSMRTWRPDLNPQNPHERARHGWLRPVNPSTGEQIQAVPESWLSRQSNWKAKLLSQRETLCPGDKVLRKRAIEKNIWCLALASVYTQKGPRTPVLTCM